MKATRCPRDELAEPKHQLPRALVIVLLLHLVALFGVFSFGMVRSRNIARALPSAQHLISDSKILSQGKKFEESRSISSAGRERDSTSLSSSTHVASIRAEQRATEPGKLGRPAAGETLVRSPQAYALQLIQGGAEPEPLSKKRNLPR